MRFFVTGATGFIGSHLTLRLLADGHEVHALVRTPSKAGLIEEAGAHLVPGDLAAFADADFELPEVDVFVHLAAVIAADNDAQYRALNFESVQDVIACIRRQSWTPSRFVFASSLAAAGPSVPGQPHSEADTLNPVESYGRSKCDAEAFLDTVEFPVTSFRPPIVIGRRDPAFLTLFKMANRGVGFRVAGTPQQISFVAIDDLVDAIVVLSGDTRPGHQRYFTTSPDMITVNELWDALEAGVGRRVRMIPIPPFLLRILSVFATLGSALFRTRNQLDRKQVNQMLAPAFVCSGDRMDQDLGWRAEVGLQDAIDRAVSGYREDGWL